MTTEQTKTNIPLNHTLSSPQVVQGHGGFGQTLMLRPCCSFTITPCPCSLPQDAILPELSLRALKTLGINTDIFLKNGNEII